MSNVVPLYPEKVGETESMEAKAFREQIIRPALKVTGLWSYSAENLLLGTALAESGLRSVVQIGGGGALSFFQVEKATYADCVRYLNRSDKSSLKRSILAACYMEMFPPFECFTWNMRLSCLIARIKYYMHPDALPAASDIEGAASYWLKNYNAGGKGTIEHYLNAWRATR